MGLWEERPRRSGLWETSQPGTRSCARPHPECCTRTPTCRCRICRCFTLQASSAYSRTILRSLLDFVEVLPRMLCVHYGPTEASWNFSMSVKAVTGVCCSLKQAQIKLPHAEHEEPSMSALAQDSDCVLQVGLKMQFQGSQGQLMFFFGNKGDSLLERLILRGPPIRPVCLPAGARSLPVGTKEASPGNTPCRQFCLALPACLPLSICGAGPCC